MMKCSMTTLIHHIQTHQQIKMINETNHEFMQYKMCVGFLSQSINFIFYSKNWKERKNTLATDITHMLSQACR